MRVKWDSSLGEACCQYSEGNATNGGKFNFMGQNGILHQVATWNQIQRDFGDYGWGNLDWVQENNETNPIEYGLDLAWDIMKYGKQLLLLLLYLISNI